MKKGEAYYRYSYEELLAFYPQTSLLLEAVVPLEEGPIIMAEDTASQGEKDMPLYMVRSVGLGDPFFKVMEDTGIFPAYMVRMAELGQQTGTMDQIMKSLSDYYEKEHWLLQIIKNAATCPMMMVVILLMILFVLFSKVIPVFNKVYEQLRAQVLPVAVSAMRLGGWLNGAALIAEAALALALCGIQTTSKFGKHFTLAKRLMNFAKGRNKTVLAVTNRRFTAALAPTLKGGMELEKGIDPAKEPVENEGAAVRIGKCSGQLQAGGGYYQAMKDTGLFSGFYI